MSAAPLFENRGSPLISRPDNNALYHLSRRRAFALPSSLHSMPPTTRRTAPISGSSDGSEQARPPDPPRRTPRRTPKILPKLNAKDKSTHSGFKIKAESAMRQLDVLDALTDGPPTRAAVIRDHPDLEPSVAEQAAELTRLLQVARHEYDQINKEAYGYVIEMCDLDNNPSLLAKIKPISKKADGRARRGRR